MILGNLDEEREFEDVVADLWAESDDMGDFRQRMENLGDRLIKVKAEYQEQQANDNKIFGDRFYIEIMRHGIPEQDIVNDGLIKLAYTRSLPVAFVLPPELTGGKAG